MGQPSKTTPPVLLLDGGLGTTLSQPPHSLHFSPDTPLWSSHALITHPEALSPAHRSFVYAGADVLLTATYQASFEGFARTKRVSSTHGKEALGSENECTTVDTDVPPHDSAERNGDGYIRAEAARYMRSAVPLARSAFSGSPRAGLVALSLGPYGATMTPSQEYTGAYPAHVCSRAVLRAWHADRLAVFLDDAETWAGIDLVAFETLKRVDEVRALRDVMRDVVGRRTHQEGVQWWLSCVVPGKVEDREGEAEVRSLVRAMLDEQEGAPRPCGIGVNCTGVEKVGAIVRVCEETAREQSVNGMWLVLYPDGAHGKRYDSERMDWVDAEARDRQEMGTWDEELWAVVKDAKESGIWDKILVGGCCQTGPQQVRALRNRIDADAEAG